MFKCGMWSAECGMENSIQVLKPFEPFEPFERFINGGNVRELKV